MGRQDIIVEDKDYQEIIKWAKLGNDNLYKSIEANRIIIEDDTNHKVYFKIRKDDISEVEAEYFLFFLFDNDQYSTTSEECIYFGHLAEIWRPIAEGLL